MSSIRRLATKTLLISSCFLALFVSGFIGSMVSAKEAKPIDSPCIHEDYLACWENLKTHFDGKH
jgi:hypothetical protein